jgi:DNA-directed RNA polymerase subunit RPC12/RpoP
MAVKRKEDPAVSVEENCAKCGRKISHVEPKYRLRIKGKEAPYCQGCAKKILKPQEQSEESV